MQQPSLFPPPATPTQPLPEDVQTQAREELVACLVKAVGQASTNPGPLPTLFFPKPAANRGV
jgi:hypothetical protein